MGTILKVSKTIVIDVIKNHFILNTKLSLLIKIWLFKNNFLFRLKIQICTQLLSLLQNNTFWRNFGFINYQLSSYN